MEFKRRYGALNIAQKRAVDQIDGPVMVLAGPGTGKTELLAVRVAAILQRTDTLPENILCLTYTDAGARAMRTRLIDIIGEAAYKVAIHTFHGFGSEVIASHRDVFYSGALFAPADSVSTYEILQQIFGELPLGDQLSTMLGGQYTYLADTQRAISELKRAGLTSDELLAILDAGDVESDAIERLLVPILSDRVSKSMLPKLTAALEELRQLPPEPARYGVPSLLTVTADNLALALGAETTPPVSQFKKRFFDKDASDKLMLKSRERAARLRTVAWVYERYMAAMEKAALYDYDDMILQVVHALEVNDELRFNLQETYQYLLVDEFQDTNLAQLRILESLTNNPVNEDRPNIFVVGDDDQAIYSFQGADISNILTFTERYAAAERIVLTENYRSGQAILDKARSVITSGDDRLEARDPALDKSLHAQTTSGDVRYVSLETPAHERQWIAHEIKQQITAGTPANHIAVLLHHHRDIQALLPYLNHEGIAVSYERRDDVFELEPIQQLVTLSRLIVRLAQGRHDEAEALLPEVMAHPAWGFSPQDMWALSLKAYTERRHWLDAMEALPAFSEFRQWIIERVAESHYQPLEPTLDTLIGIPDSERDGMVSPLYQHYFSQDALARDPEQYLIFLKALRVLRQQLIEYHPAEPLTLGSFTEFVDLHLTIGDRIQLVQPARQDHSVLLMTAHGAKGLEFDTVFVACATDSEWGEHVRGRPHLIGYPENLALAPLDQSIDERRRLFYVAMTRAKQNLIMSYARNNDNDKSQLPVAFLSAWQPEVIAGDETPEAARELAQTAWYQPLLTPQTDLKKALADILETYRLSATHLTSFVDLSHGGPDEFVALRLLKFPQASSPQASYGSAIHRTLMQAHTHFTVHGTLKPLEDTLADFEQNLQRERLDSIDLEKYIVKGSAELSAYLAARASSFNASQKPELGFARAGSHLGEAQLTGSIDLADIDAKNKTITVCDYKTGRPTSSWNGKTESEKIKLHKYRLQLLFYKLLAENSRDYSGFTVTGGTLEFIQPSRSGEVMSLPLEFDEAEVEGFKKLVLAVWQRITTLTIPDTADYEPTLKGILAFEQALIDAQP